MIYLQLYFVFSYRCSKAVLLSCTAAWNSSETTKTSIKEKEKKRINIPAEYQFPNHLVTAKLLLGQHMPFPTGWITCITCLYVYSRASSI